MTKELLEQYPHICAEIKMLKRRSPVLDGDAEALKILEQQKSDIEAFIRVLPNSRARLMVSLRALEGNSWNYVAAQIGGNATPRNLAVAYCRLIKEYCKEEP